MQPICEICDEALDPDKVGRVFQNSFYHDACFHRDRGKLGQKPAEPAGIPAEAVVASVDRTAPFTAQPRQFPLPHRDKIPNSEWMDWNWREALPRKGSLKT